MHYRSCASLHMESISTTNSSKVLESMGQDWRPKGLQWHRYKTYLSHVKNSFRTCKHRCQARNHRRWERENWLEAYSFYVKWHFVKKKSNEIEHPNWNEEINIIILAWPKVNVLEFEASFRRQHLRSRSHHPFVRLPRSCFSHNPRVLDNLYVHIFCSGFHNLHVRYW